MKNLADGTITIDVVLDTKTLEESLANVSKMVNNAMIEANLKLGALTGSSAIDGFENFGKGLVTGGFATIEDEEKYYDDSLNLFENYSQKRLDGEGKHNENLLGKQNELYSNKLSAMQKEQDKENSFVNTSQKNIISFLSSFSPNWYSIGEDYMRNLQSGLESRLYAVEQLISELRQKLMELASLGGSEYDASYSTYGIPAYGTGGVVTKAHLAVVGDTPEAIIPLNRLNDMILGAADFAFGGGVFKENNSETKEVIFHQTNNFFEKTESPAQSAQAIRRVNKELAQYV